MTVASHAIGLPRSKAATVTPSKRRASLLARLAVRVWPVSRPRPTSFVADYLVRHAGACAPRPVCKKGRGHPKCPEERRSGRRHRRRRPCLSQPDHDGHLNVRESGAVATRWQVPEEGRRLGCGRRVERGHVTRRRECVGQTLTLGLV